MRCSGSRLRPGGLNLGIKHQAFSIKGYEAVILKHP